MKVILPVAGKGVRLQPYTNDLPRCLLPVGGKTIIDWIVEDILKDLEKPLALPSPMSMTMNLS